MANNLGPDLTKSIAIIEVLQDSLKKFHGRNEAIKRGLRNNKSYNDSIGKDINKAILDAAALSNTVDELKDKIISVTPKSNPRFDSGRQASNKTASQRIVSKFLTVD